MSEEREEMRVTGSNDNTHVEKYNVTLQYLY